MHTFLSRSTEAIHSHRVSCTTNCAAGGLSKLESQNKTPEIAEHDHAARPRLVLSISSRLDLQASGWAIRRLRIPKPTTTPLSACHWWGEARRKLGGEASTSLDTARRGSPHEIPRRCIGPGKLEHSNWSGRGRHVERGPVWSLCDSKNHGELKKTPMPENSPAGGPKSASRPGADHLQFCTECHCHFASQDRNASPKKASGAVNTNQSNGN